MAEDAEPAFALLRTTVETEAAASAMARRLIEAQVACCVHRSAIHSTYEWDGRIEDAQEWLVEARVPANGIDEAWKFMREGHPYDTPLVEAIDVGRVDPAYAAWAERVTGRQA